jgi:nitrite reductase/ring-hydroxylating ferredoxin subunit
MTHYYVCKQSELSTNQTRGFELELENRKVDLFVLRQDDTVYVYLNHCPHLGIPLNWQPDEFLSTDGDYIQCSTHGALFTLDNGHCVVGPCSGQRLEALPYVIRDEDEIWLELTS